MSTTTKIPSTSSSGDRHHHYTSRGPYKPVVIIHGGAGAIHRSTLPPSLYHQYHTSLLTYLLSAKSLLDNCYSASAVDAACHAVSLLEDNPLFNCGRGSVFTTAGENEMEASLAVTCIDPDTKYEGMTKRSAAVSMLRETRHPILLARAVLNMADTDDDDSHKTASMHGHLSGAPVETWGWESQFLERKDRSWFWTKKRWEEHRRGLGLVVDDDNDDDDSVELPSQGTVGAVCMDSWGVICAATSTGGLTNKLPGRIGDTPTVGAGFWAESWTVDPLSSSEDPSFSCNQSVAERIATRARADLDFWIGDCFGLSLGEETDRKEGEVDEKEQLIIKQQQQSKFTTENLQGKQKTKKEKRRAVGMSGTGNGDSFLRVNACRTAAAIARFGSSSSSSSSSSLADAIGRVAGPGGELQKSAGDRWGKTGEGDGGIIGIEVLDDDERDKQGKAVFGFNCGGMWRAYFDKTENGDEVPKVMVFREEYH